MNVEEFKAYYGLMQRLAEFYRIPRHELQFVTRRRSTRQMIKAEVEELAHMVASEICVERGQKVPKRKYINRRRSELNKLSGDLGRQIKLFQYEA